MKNSASYCSIPVLLLAPSETGWISVLWETGGEFKKARVKCTTRENFAKIGQARRPGRVLRKQEEGGTNVIKAASYWPYP